eukprot:5576627-Prymnesium_polylepis.1
MLRPGPNVKILGSQKLNVVLVNVKTAVSCLKRKILPAGRSLRSRACCSSVNTVQNLNCVRASTFGCSTRRDRLWTGLVSRRDPHLETHSTQDPL